MCPSNSSKSIENADSFKDGFNLRNAQPSHAQPSHTQLSHPQTKTQSPPQFEVTFERAAVGIAHVGLQGQWLRINQRLCEIVGYSEEELKSKRIQEVTHPDDWEVDYVYLMQLLTGKRSRYSLEKRLIHKSGSPVWVDLSVSLVTQPSGEPDYCIATIKDINSQKEIEANLEANLEASEQRFQKAILAAPSPVIICAEDGEVLQISEGWTRLSGYRHEDIPTLSDWAEKAHGDRKIDVLANINQLFKLDRTVDEGEFTIQTRLGAQNNRTDAADENSPLLGTKRIWQFSTAPLGNLADGRRAIVSMAADVTELKRSQRQVEQINQTLEARISERTAQLETANDELNAFAFTVSHDLGAPLRAMEGFSQALLEDYADSLDPLGREYAERIAQSAAHMDQLIQDILKYSRLNQATIQKRTINLDRAISRVCKELSATIEATQAKIDIEPNIPLVEGAPQIIDQILTNLISNAIKFVPPGTTPRISISAQNVAPVMASRVESDPKRVRLQIADNGIGIAKEHQQRIFDAFERLHGVESYRGAGIGLAIVKRGAEKLGGQVGVESRLGAGSLFWVELNGANEIS